MTYDLAKKLKDAGFPQEGEGSIQWTDQEPYLGMPVYIPTLEELIEACGHEKIIIWENEGIWYAAKYDTSIESETYRYVSGNCIDDTFHDAQEGSTPSEALANLWLTLNKK